MSETAGVWRRHLLTWAVPLVGVLLACAALLVYRARLVGAVERLESRQAAARADLEDLRREKEQTERFLAVADAGAGGIEALYDNHFATEAERFTDAIFEIKRLAAAAGLSPTSMSYPRTELPDGGLVQRAFTFSVTGTYDQLRAFVNLLELSDHFLILEQIGLSQSEVAGGQRDPMLAISLNVVTIFRSAETAPARAGGAAS